MESSAFTEAAVACAVDRFRKPPARLNCAQAVVAGYSDPLKLPPGSVDHLAGLGGGRAESGACGALYAAKLLVRDPIGRARVEEAFVRDAGSSRCREIRKLGQLSCHDCVATACRLVGDELATLPEASSPNS